MSHKFHLDLHKKTTLFRCVTSIVCSMISNYRSGLMTDMKVSSTVYKHSSQSNSTSPTFLPPYVQCTFSFNFVCNFIASCRIHHYSDYCATIVWNLCVFHAPGSKWKLNIWSLTCATGFMYMPFGHKSNTGTNESWPAPTPMNGKVPSSSLDSESLIQAAFTGAG